MNKCSLNMDTLDFLNLAKTERKDLNNFKTEAYQKHRYKELRQKYVKKEYHENEIRTSASLFLNQINEQLMIEQQSFVTGLQSLENPRGKKSPLIKITIIPQTVQTSVPKIFNKRRQVLKRIQKTVSQEIYSVAGNNAYTRENSVNDLKSTTSDILTCNIQSNKSYNVIDNNVPLSRLNESKQLLRYLNMDDNNKKIHRKKRASATFNYPYIKQPDNSYASLNDCCCVNKSKRNFVDALHNHKSRLTIVGRVGLNDNDKYVLKCAATVNDKPIETNYSQIEPVSFPIESDNDEERSSSYCQSCGCTCTTSKNKNIRKQSHATQVNLNLINSSENKDKMIQCSCSHVVNIATDVSDDKYTNDEVKGCQSPLVVISVYPKQDTMENAGIHQIQIRSPMKNERHLNPLHAKPLENNVKGPHKEHLSKQQIVRNNRANNLLGKSRSPSPNMFEKQNITSNKTTVKKTDIPKSKSPNRGISNRIREHKNNVDVKSEISKFERFPKTLVTKTEKQAQNVKTNTHLIKSYDVNVMKRANNGQEAFKRALINDYERSLTNQQKKTANPIFKPSHEESKVTINIDGENEFYNVLFHQHNLDTDLAIRKTIKEKVLQKQNGNKNDVYPKIPSADVTVNNCTDMPLQTTMSALRIRDSLEINHRRDRNSHSIKGKLNERTKSPISSHTASVKHFKGDTCCVPNPMQRDREIRELLGIDNIRQNVKSNVVQNCTTDIFRTSTQHNNYYGKCEKSFQTNPNMLKILPVKCCKINREIKNSRLVKNKTNGTQCESPLESNSPYQQLILNRNIRVFLEVDKFTKKKPIVLTRHQYSKVKKTIEKTISHESRKRPYFKTSIVSVGELKIKRIKQQQKLRNDKQVQTESEYDNMQTIVRHHNNGRVNKMSNEEVKDTNDKPLAIRKAYGNNDNEKNTDGNKHTISSLEVLYTSVSCTKQITRESNDVTEEENMNIIFNNVGKTQSLHTIFKGRRKSVTPNLGTSIYSLYSGDTEITGRSIKSPLSEALKPKKTFLNKLISCFVMTSTKVSDVKKRAVPHERQMSSSFDPYYINSSLAAIEMSSSLYDTSASFHSNHTTWPVNKIKRGFFSSVRGFLKNRK